MLLLRFLHTSCRKATSIQTEIFFTLMSSPIGLMSRGQRFDESHLRCWTQVLGNLIIQLFATKPWSNLSQIEWPSV